MNNVEFAIRQLLRNPAVSIAAVLTLGLAIGANTSVFSFMDAALLRPLSYPNADRIVRIGSINQALGVADSRSSDLNIVDWQERSIAFQELAAFQEWDGVLTIEGRSESVRVNWATPNLISILGVRPVLGRLLADSDAGTGVMLPYGVWQRFGGDASIIGKSVRLDGDLATVVGILPLGVTAPAQGFRSEDQVFIASDLRRTGYPRGLQLRNVVGRLKEGVTIAQAQADLSRVAAKLEQEHPDTNRGWGVKVSGLKAWETRLVRGQLLAVYCATAIVLLIACLNVSNLILIRGEARRKELSIRRALGCSRGRLIGQLLMECFVLSLAGGLAGLLLSWWGGKSLLTFAPSSLGMYVPRLDSSVFVSAILVTILAGLVSGLFPVLRLGRDDFNHDLIANGRSASTGASLHHLLNGLVVGQIAISMTLLIAASLAIASFQKLMQVDPGFSRQNRICFRVGTFSKLSEGERLLEQLSQLPGVEAAGAANVDLLNDVFSNGIRITADDPAAPGGVISGTVDVWHATSNYFSAAGILLRAGRVFESADRHDVVIVNDALARRFFPNGEAIGKAIRVPWTNSPGSLKRIIGVVGSVKQHGVREPDVPIYYMHFQGEDMGNIAVTMKTAAKPAAMLPMIREEIRKVDSELVVNHVTTTEEIVEGSLSSHRFATALMSGFGVLAMILTVIGLYGVMSYAVYLRTKEMGIRLALGATTGEVFRLIVGRGLRLAGTGVVAGLACSFLMTRWLRALLFDVSPTDPMTFAAMAILIGAVALLTCFGPARRAARVDPVKALRGE